MGFKEGMQAINMQMPDYVPRTEYSAHVHWDLVKKVTGIDTDILENRDRASAKFIKDWDFSLLWYVNIHKNYLERYGKISNMGHAVYAESASGQSDKDEKVFHCLRILTMHWHWIVRNFTGHLIRKN